MKKRSILNSPRIEEQKRRKRKILKIKIIFFFFCFLLLITGLVFLSRWQKLNIENVEVSGNKIIDTEAIQKIVKEDMQGHYIWFFPKTNFLIFPKNRIKKDLENKFKRLYDISINTNNPKTLKITVSEREGKYLWCGDTIPASINDTTNYKCYFTNDNGYIFDEAPYFSGNVYFKLYGPLETKTDSPLGNYFLKDKFAEVVALKEATEQIGLNPTFFWLDENGDGNISLSSLLNTGPKIIFKIDSDYQSIAENLQAAITTDPLQTKLKNETSSLLYIDLRFGNKVYYKFSTENNPISDPVSN